MERRRAIIADEQAFELDDKGAVGLGGILSGYCLC